METERRKSECERTAHPASRSRRTEKWMTENWMTEKMAEKWMTEKYRPSNFFVIHLFVQSRVPDRNGTGGNGVNGE
jgi:hypothetical protein